MSHRIRALALLLTGASALALDAAGAERLSADGVEQLVALLEQQNLIDPEQADGIRGRKQAQDAWRSWIDRLRFSGEFRGRWEGFWYDDDPLGHQRPDRQRLRYRLRLAVDAPINPWIDAHARLASGTVVKSRNQTLGSGDDFDPDAFSIDYAYVTLHPLADRAIPFGGRRLDLQFGKMPNPFRSKIGKDLLIWDGDITPEGVTLHYAVDPCDCLGFGLEAGYLMIDENSTSRDPHVVALQLEAEGRPRADVVLGSALSYYAFRSLDPAFFQRGVLGSISAGNVVGGLSDDEAVDLGDLRLWGRYEGIEDWPVLVYGNVVHNFSAVDRSGTRAGAADLGWSIGLEIGEPGRHGRLGVGYFQLEANAVPANFTDSDIFDGRTNGEGWSIYGARRVLANTDLRFEILLADALDKDIVNPVAVGDPPVIVNPSLDDSDRIRVRTDLVVHF